MNILIIYATIEGQSGKIARFVRDKAEGLGHQVSLVDADGADEIKFADVDAAILVASVHQQRHPRTFEALLTAHEEDLNRTKTLFLSVSLSAAFPEGMEEAVEYAREMQMRTGFNPDIQVLVAGALKIGQYDYFAQQVVRHVVLRNRPFEAGASDHEFTDWAALETAVTAFVG